MIAPPRGRDVVAGRRHRSHNPVTPYRFLLEGGAGGYRWLNGAGVHRPRRHRRRRLPPRHVRRRPAVAPPRPSSTRSSPTASPRRQPPPPAGRRGPSPAAWDDPVRPRGRQPASSTAATSPASRPTSTTSWPSGSTSLYLTPFFPAPSSHRYNAVTFDHVDPLLGGDERSGQPRRRRPRPRPPGDRRPHHQPQRRHPRVVPGRAGRRRLSPEAGFYFFRDHPDDYVAWFGVPSLPKFDHRRTELRRRLRRRRRLGRGPLARPPYELDGWRVDVANMTGRIGDVDVNRDVARTIRAHDGRRRPDAYLVAEHCHDAHADLRGDGWHGTMSYAASRGRSGDGWPGPRPPASASWAVPVQPAPARRRPWRPRCGAFSAIVPWRTLTANLTCSARTTRPGSARSPADAERPRGRARPADVAYPGVPMVFAGDEVGSRASTRTTAASPCRGTKDRWDRLLSDVYRDLIAVRRSSPALRDGGLRWAHAGDDTLVFLRESRDERVLVAGRVPRTSRWCSTRACSAWGARSRPSTATRVLCRRGRQGGPARSIRGRRARLEARSMNADREQADG